MAHHNYKELRVWQKSMDLVENVYRLTAEFPLEERFGLISQLRRCSVSVASNIAEGAGRGTDKEFKRFLEIALGSCNELDTQLILSVRLKHTVEEELKDSFKLIREIGNMLINLIKKLDP